MQERFPNICKHLQTATTTNSNYSFCLGCRLQASSQMLGGTNNINILSLPEITNKRHACMLPDTRIHLAFGEIGKSSFSLQICGTWTVVCKVEYHCHFQTIKIIYFYVFQLSGCLHSATGF